MLRLPGWPWSCLVGELSSIPFFLSLNFSSLSFPPPPFFLCWHEMPPGEPAGPNFQTLFIHSTSTRAGVPGSGLDVEEAKGCGENLCALVS